MKQRSLLIIFTRNIIYGKVKTRLAATIGNEKALHIYKKLVEHTQAITNQLQVDRMVYYSEFAEHNDVFNGCLKNVQAGDDLGAKMSNAFKDAFDGGYEKAVVIGTDCFEITREIFEQAFEQLNTHEIVVGPAVDGGYYLLGMQSHYPTLFENIKWSSDTVLSATINACDQLKLSYFLLPVLNDVDEEKDLKETDLARL